MQLLESLDAIQYLPKAGTVTVRSNRGEYIERLGTGDALRLLRHKIVQGMVSGGGKLKYLTLTVPLRRYRRIMNDSRLPPMPRWHITRPKTTKGDLTWPWRWDRVRSGQCGQPPKSVFVIHRSRYGSH